jgi:uncharacterized C2H2 Zn-finger protein
MPDATTTRHPDYRLHCRQCPETFVEMVDLLRHGEKEHEARAPRKAAKARKNRGGADHAN